MIERRTVIVAYLRLVEAECSGDLDASRPGQVAVEVELFLELGELFVGEVGAAAVRHGAGAAQLSGVVRRRRRRRRVHAVRVEHRPRHCTQHAHLHTTAADENVPKVTINVLFIYLFI